MLSTLKLSDDETRQLSSLITQVCMSQEFKELKGELREHYIADGIDDPEITAFKDALYTILHQMEDFNSSVKELL